MVESVQDQAYNNTFLSVLYTAISINVVGSKIKA